MTSAKVPDLGREQFEMIKRMAPNFTDSQIISWFADFKKFSSEHDYLTLKDFIRFYKKIFSKNQSDSDEFFEYIFKAFDVDNSGYIDFKEFMIALAINSNGNIQTRLDWIFSAFDIDNNGYIDHKEFKKIIKSIYLMLNLKPNGENSTSFKFQVATTFDQLDANKDNRISKKEFIAGCMNDEFLYGFLTQTGL